MMKKILLFICVISLTTNVFAQSREVKKDFKYLVNKIEKDYPGFNEKVNATTKDRYDFLVDSLKNALNDKNSYQIYSTYANFFKDHHLRVCKIRKRIKRELTDNSSYGEALTMDEKAAKEYIKNSSNLSSIEGIWETFRGEKIFIKKEKNSFVGIKFKDQGSWKKGEVRYEFIPKADSTYELVYHTKVKGRTPSRDIASLQHNGKVLEIHGTKFFTKPTGKDGQYSMTDKVFAHTYRMKYPNGLNIFNICRVLSDSTFYIRVGGFSRYDKKFIEESLENNKELIRHTPNMIIDIRGNGGGQDSAYQPLADLIYTDPYMSKGIEWYATKGWIKNIKDVIKNKNYKNGEAGKKELEHLLAAMETNVGGFVFHPDMGKECLVKKDTVYEYPKKVGIIINEGVASSGEQFVLTAKKSKKVTIFGNKNTVGVLDYSNAVPVYFPSEQYYCYIPQTRSGRLPENPIDNIGISPDVNIPFPSTRDLYDDIDIWVRYVKNYLEF